MSNELLAKIDSNLSDEVWLYNMSEALRTVVEIHREVTDTWNKEQVCFACNSYANPVKYPCKTILAIQSVLD